MVFSLLVVATILFIVLLKSVFNRVNNPVFKPLVTAAAVQGGVIFWYCVSLIRACVISHFQLIATSSLNMVFVLLLIVGLVWLIKLPGKEPIIFLIIFQVMSIMMNSAALMSLSFETGSRVVVVSMLLRCLAVYLLVMGFTKVKGIGYNKGNN